MSTQLTGRVREALDLMNSMILSGEGHSEISENTVMAGRTALAEMESRLESLPFRPADLARALVVFRTSSNAHGEVNFGMLPTRIEESLSDAGRRELVSLMLSVAMSIDPQAFVDRAEPLIPVARRKAGEKADG